MALLLDQSLSAPLVSSMYDGCLLSEPLALFHLQAYAASGKLPYAAMCICQVCVSSLPYCCLVVTLSAHSVSPLCHSQCASLLCWLCSHLSVFDVLDLAASFRMSPRCCQSFCWRILHCPTQCFACCSNRFELSYSVHCLQQCFACPALESIFVCGSFAHQYRVHWQVSDLMCFCWLLLLHCCAL